MSDKIENKYLNAKIYKIIDKSNNNVYIGSTIKTLKQRLSCHEGHYQMYVNGKYTYVSSFEILQNNNYCIELIEAYPCESKEELEKKEGFVIKSIECVNKRIAGQIKDMVEYQKQYREQHKKIILENAKQYREQHKKEIIEYEKQYKETNKLKIKEYKKQYREQHKNEMKQYYEQHRKEIEEYQKQYREQHKQKTNCICGANITVHNKAHHERSQKHIKFVQAQQLQSIE
jgi:hypothetical protein